MAAKGILASRHRPAQPGKLSTTVSMDSVRSHLAATPSSHRARRSIDPGVAPILPSKPAVYSMSMVSKDVLAKIASFVAFFLRTVPTTSCGSRSGILANCSALERGFQKRTSLQNRAGH